MQCHQRNMDNCKSKQQWCQNTITQIIDNQGHVLNEPDYADYLNQYFLNRSLNNPLPISGNVMLTTTKGTGPGVDQNCGNVVKKVIYFFLNHWIIQ